MTPTDFAAALDYLGLRQAAFARIAGVHTTTVSRWATGASSVPVWAALLLDAWKRCPDALAEASGQPNPWDEVL